MGPDAMILVFWMLSFKSTFPLSSFSHAKLWMVDNWQTWDCNSGICFQSLGSKPLYWVSRGTKLKHGQMGCGGRHCDLVTEASRGLPGSGHTSEKWRMGLDREWAWDADWWGQNTLLPRKRAGAGEEPGLALTQWWSGATIRTESRCSMCPWCFCLPGPFPY